MCRFATATQTGGAESKGNVGSVSLFTLRSSLFTRTRSLTVAALLKATIATLLVVPVCLGDTKPEAAPFSDEAFYEGLIALKLYDLLEYDLDTHPPDDPLAALLLRRRILLGIAEDATADPSRRRNALADGNDILSRLIREHGTDERVLDWQLALAKSLIYEQAEPYYSAILYNGPTPSDRRSLRSIMERALGTLTRSRSFLDDEYARIDELPLDAYERLDDRGYVAALEAAMPQVEYMLLWAKFYLAIAYDDQSATRRELLEQILQVLTQETELLTESHTATHAQAQSLLLAGMTCRRLADRESAMRFLQDAATVTDSIANPEERRDLQWIATLAEIERIRTLCDARRPDDAMVVLHELRRRMDRSGTGFSRRLVLALLESTVIQTREQRRPASVSEHWSSPLSDNAVAPLIALSREKPAYRDEVYSVLYLRLADHSEPEKLHPFQQCAIIAGDIREATRLRQRSESGGDSESIDARDEADAAAMRLIDAAIVVATNLTARRDGLDESLRCEALYNLAVAEHLRGRRLDAASHFAEVAKSCPRFGRSLAAATYAVEIAAQLAEDPSLRARSDVQDLLLMTLRTLDTGFEDSEAARYWRFFLAQAVEDFGRLDEAASLYARIDKDHPHFLIAQFRAARCRILSLTESVTNDARDGVAIKRRAGDARRAVRQFQTLAADHTEPAVKRLLAEADVLLAEMEVLPGVVRFEDALSLLSNFEQLHPTDRDLIGRVLRVRIVAYEATDRLDDARQAVPRFIASSPQQAGPTLQALFDATRKEIDQYRKAGRNDLADQKARSALLFAEQLYAWATSSPSLSKEFDPQVLGVQLAEAYLEAGQPEHALSLFQKGAENDALLYGDGLAHHPRIVLGYARTLERLGRFEDALPLFNRVFVEAAQDAPRRFAALLGDLRCRTELGQDPQGIIDVIRQQRFLHPDMGGEQLKAAFAELQRRNKERQ